MNSTYANLSHDELYTSDGRRLWTIGIKYCRVHFYTWNPNVANDPAVFFEFKGLVLEIFFSAQKIETTSPQVPGVF